MTAIIETEKLTKTYGTHRGIVDVDLRVDEGEVFGFLGPNGAGKTTTIRTILDLIRPTSGRALVFGIESSDRPDRHPPARRLHPGRVHAVRPADRRPDADATSPTSGAASTGLPGLAHRAVRDRPVAASSRSTRRATSRRSDSSSRSSTGRSCSSWTSRRRASTPSCSSRSTPSSASRRPKAGRSSCRATSCRRWSGPATASPSSATAGSSKVDSVEGLRDLAHHQVELRFAGPVPTAEFATPRRRERRRRRGPRPAHARVRPDHATRPGRRPPRPARLRQPRAEPRGDVPRPVRRGRRSHGSGVADHDRHRPHPVSPGAASTASAASTRRPCATRAWRSSSWRACWARCSCPDGAAFGEAYATPESRAALATLVASLPPVWPASTGRRSRSTSRRSAARSPGRPAPRSA